MSQIKVYYQLTVSDTKTGKTIHKTRKKLCRSFVLQFLKYIEFCMRHAYGGAGTAVSITDTGNTARSLSADNQAFWLYFSVDCPVSDDTYGVLVGSDNTAETNTDYVLGTQIAEGAAAGQLNHGAHVWTATQVVGANVDLKIQRPFINNSGGAVTIEEVVIYLKSRTPWYFCILRETTGTVNVAAGQTATVDLTVRTTV